MFWAAGKLRSFGLKFSGQRRNVSSGLPFPGHMLSFWIKPGYLHYLELLTEKEAPLVVWKRGGTFSQTAESYESGTTKNCVN